MKIKELETIHGLLVIIRDRLKTNIKDMVARGMIDELYDQLEQKKDDPEAAYILEQLVMIKVLLAPMDMV